VPLTDCRQEPEIVAAMLGAEWELPACESLRAHAAQCPVCGEAVRLMQLLSADRVALQDVAVPASGLMWFRLQRRARAEAERRALRPIGLVQFVALACVAGLAIALAPPLGKWAWPRLDGLVGHLADWRVPGVTLAASMSPTLAASAGLAVIALSLIAGSLIWYVVSADREKTERRT
jgi:hypothetical protein